MGDTVSAVLTQIIIMFIIVVIGAICYKTKIINDDGKKQLSNLVLKVVNPLLIFLSYQTEFRFELLSGFLWTAAMAVITFILFIAASRIIFRNKSDRNNAIERFSVVYSNCGFMGTPLIFGVFGADGVFIMNGFITVFNLFVWTHGVMTIREESDRKSVLKAFRAPAVIAIAAGLLCFITGLRLPDIVFKALNNVAEMTTPLAMIVAGASIMSAGLLKSIKNIRAYLIALLRLLVFPLAAFLIIMWLPCDDIPKLITLMEIACPTATIGTMFAIQYNRNSEYASQIFAITTIFSLATLPIAAWIGSRLLEIF